MPSTRESADPNDPRSFHPAAMMAALTAQSVRYFEPDEVAGLVAAARAEERGTLTALITAARELVATLRTKAVFHASDKDGSAAVYMHSATQIESILTGTPLLAELYALGAPHNTEAAEAVVPPDGPRSCNRHADCDAADAKVRAQGTRSSAEHCYDDSCEDCFGA